MTKCSKHFCRVGPFTKCLANVPSPYLEWVMSLISHIGIISYYFQLFRIVTAFRAVSCLAPNPLFKMWLTPEIADFVVSKYFPHSCAYPSSPEQPHSPTLSCTLPCSPVLSHTLLCSPVLSHTLPHSPALSHTLPRSPVLSHALPHFAPMSPWPPLYTSYHFPSYLPLAPLFLDLSTLP
jgi:hypothetical protein